MVEVTIEITNYCDRECTYCSSDATPDGEHLPYEKIEEFLDSVSSVSRINISGGEPLAHPEFYRILKLCKLKAYEVWVYTNAIENIMYNSGVITEINVHANICMFPGERMYIPKLAHKIHILQLVAQGRASDMKPQDISLSGNLCGKCPCDHIYLRSDGKVAEAPCKKE